MTDFKVSDIKSSELKAGIIIETNGDNFQKFPLSTARALGKINLITDGRISDEIFTGIPAAFKLPKNNAFTVFCRPPPASKNRPLTDSVSNPKSCFIRK